MSTLTTPRPGVRSRVLPTSLALAGASIAFMSLYLAAGVLTPLLVDYKLRMDFAPEVLTVAFAVYAVGFLVSMLVLGSLSDHIGRRPVLIAGLVIQVLSNVMFLAATGVSWVIAGRVVQGIASGAATATFTAIMVELSPARNKRLGAILGSICLTGGLALGSLLGGLAIELDPAASVIIFTVLIVMTVLGAVVAFFSPETVTRAPGALRSLIPRISVPRAARLEFLAAAPVVAAVWMLAGLSGGLAPSMVRSVFGINSPFIGGFAGFIAPAVSTVIGLVFNKVNSRTAMLFGIYAAILGSAGIIGGVLLGRLPVMILGQAVAGVAFGSAFTAALKLLIPFVQPHQRAGIVASIYMVAYAAFGIPIVIEGYLIEPLGEIPPMAWYTGLTILLALISLLAQLRLQYRREPAN